MQETVTFLPFIRIIRKLILYAMNIDDRVRCLFALEEAVELCKEHKLMPSSKLGYIDKVIEEQVEVIIETDPKKLAGKYE